MKNDQKPEKIDVTKIEITTEEPYPPNLVVTAYGIAPTGGWGPTKLDRVEYIEPPSDGIWDYVFTSIRPSPDMVVTQAEEEISDQDKWHDYDTENLKGVRINGVEKLLGCP